MTDNTQQHRNDALKRAWEEEREMVKSEAKFGEWLPIDSAPKDGRRILLSSDYTSRTDAGFWWTGINQPFHTSPPVPRWKWFEYLSEEWLMLNQPTHWMPLPASPKEKP